MLKKFGIIAASAASLLMLGATAALAASSDYGKGPESGTSVEKEQFGGLNSGDIDILDEVTVPVCLNDINVGIIAVVDILSPSGLYDACEPGVASDNGAGH